jgi:hypothetical protein
MKLGESCGNKAERRAFPSASLTAVKNLRAFQFVLPDEWNCSKE